LRGGRYDLLLVAQGRSPFQPDAREPEWAAAAGFAEVARGPRFVLYATTGGQR
jgi:hypothetical protein